MSWGRRCVADRFTTTVSLGARLARAICLYAWDQCQMFLRTLDLPLTVFYPPFGITLLEHSEWADLISLSLYSAPATWE